MRIGSTDHVCNKTSIMTIDFVHLLIHAFVEFAVVFYIGILIILNTVIIYCPSSYRYIKIHLNSYLYHRTFNLVLQLMDHRIFCRGIKSPKLVLDIAIILYTRRFYSYKNNQKYYRFVIFYQTNVPTRIKITNFLIFINLKHLYIIFKS